MYCFVRSSADAFCLRWLHSRDPRAGRPHNTNRKLTELFNAFGSDYRQQTPSNGNASSSQWTFRMFDNYSTLFLKADIYSHRMENNKSNENKLTASNKRDIPPWEGWTWDILATAPVHVACNIHTSGSRLLRKPIKRHIQIFIWLNNSTKLFTLK